MTTTVSVNEFEGPLSLLLELVEGGRYEVTQISVAKITAEFLERVHQLEGMTPEVMGEFLQMGARLLYIKSLALLPRTETSQEEDELRQLNSELDEYRRYQQAARELSRRLGQRTWQRPVVTRLDPQELPLPELSLKQLSDAFGRALKRAEPVKPSSTLRTQLSQETVMKQLRQRLSRGAFELQTVLDKAADRYEIIVTFLALLELMRTAELRVVQVGQFSPIMLEPAA